jgi:hypothetical protein
VAGQATPPPMPQFAHPSLAGKVETITDDGARWRWTGEGWTLISPPGTHSAEVEFDLAVTKTLDAAFQAIREGRAPELVAENLRQTSGDRRILEVAHSMTSEMDHPWTHQVRRLISLAIR